MLDRYFQAFLKFYDQGDVRERRMAYRQIVNPLLQKIDHDELASCARFAYESDGSSTALGVGALLEGLERSLRHAGQPLGERVGMHFSAFIAHVYDKIPNIRGVQDPDLDTLRAGHELLEAMLSRGESEMDAAHIYDIVRDVGGERAFSIAKALLVSRDEAADGRGTPYRLNKEQIPLCGRVYAIARAWAILQTCGFSAQSSRFLLHAWRDGGCFD